MNDFYAFPLPTALEALTIAGLLLAAGLVAAAILLRQRYPLLSFSIVLVALGFLYRSARLSKLGFRFVKEKRPSIW
jgi:hypothetical protein